MTNLLEVAGHGRPGPCETPPICPRCREPLRLIFSPRHVAMIHWVLNPGLAFNELVLGQRVPSRMFSCAGCQASYVHCPQCDSVLPERAFDIGFGHWLGLVCPDCGARIPCLRNATAWIILKAALPIWWFPARWLRPRYLEFERRRAFERRSKLDPDLAGKAKSEGESGGLWDSELDGPVSPLIPKV